MAKKRATKTKSSIPYIPPTSPSEIAEANRMKNLNSLMSRVTGNPFYGYDRDAQAKTQAKIDKQLGTGGKGKVVNVPNTVTQRATAKTPAMKITGNSPPRQVIVPVKDAFGNPVKSDSLRGRTTDAGTRSILDGMKNFMKSGAQGAFKGRLGGGSGGRPGTRL